MNAGRFSNQPMDEEEEEDADGNGVPDSEEGEEEVDPEDQDGDGIPDKEQMQKALGDEEFIVADEEDLLKAVSNGVLQIGDRLPGILAAFFESAGGQAAIAKAVGTVVTEEITRVRKSIGAVNNKIDKLGDFVAQEMDNSSEALAKAIGNQETFQKSISELREAQSVAKEKAEAISKAVAKPSGKPAAPSTDEAQVVSKGVGTNELTGASDQESVLSKAVSWMEKHNEAVPGLADALAVAQSGGKVADGVLKSISDAIK